MKGRMKMRMSRTRKTRILMTQDQPVHNHRTNNGNKSVDSLAETFVEPKHSPCPILHHSIVSYVSISHLTTATNTIAQLAVSRFGE